MGNNPEHEGERDITEDPGRDNLGPIAKRGVGDGLAISSIRQIWDVI